MGAWCLALFHPGSPSKKQSFSLYTALRKQWKRPQHPARSFCLGICWPTKAAKHNYKVPKPNINKGSGNIWGASFKGWFKKQNAKTSVGMFCCFQCAVRPGCCPVLWKRGAHDFRAAVQEEAWSVRGSCYSRRKVELQEWKQSFLWLLTNLCHTFLLLVPYNWAHRAHNEELNGQTGKAVQSHEISPCSSLYRACAECDVLAPQGYLDLDSLFPLSSQWQLQIGYWSFSSLIRIILKKK